MGLLGLLVIPADLAAKETRDNKGEMERQEVKEKGEKMDNKGSEVRQEQEDLEAGWDGEAAWE